MLFVSNGPVPETARAIFLRERFNSVISSVMPITKWNIRFTTVPLNLKSCFYCKSVLLINAADDNEAIC